MLLPTELLGYKEIAIYVMKGNHSSKANFLVDLLNLTINATMNASKTILLRLLILMPQVPILISSREFTRNPIAGHLS